jgi:hypothetical protein
MAPHKRVIKEPDRTLVPGRPDFERCDNKVVSARFTVANFIPKVRANCFVTGRSALAHGGFLFGRRKIKRPATWKFSLFL